MLGRLCLLLNNKIMFSEPYMNYGNYNMTKKFFHRFIKKNIPRTIHLEGQNMRIRKRNQKN